MKDIITKFRKCSLPERHKLLYYLISRLGRVADILDDLILKSEMNVIPHVLKNPRCLNLFQFQVVDIASTIHEHMQKTIQDFLEAPELVELVEAHVQKRMQQRE